MHGHLFVIEGVDGSGKATQTARLYEALTDLGYAVGQVAFPNYASPSSSLIKMYLNGDFGDSASAVNPYAASAFYAVDRFATFRQRWQDFYETGGILLADRYTTSNMVHQGGKLTDPAAKQAFLDWLADFEYRLFELPRPDAVVFLDMPPEASLALRQGRGTLKQDLRQDIHEADAGHIRAAYDNALSIAETCGWLKVACTAQDGAIRSIDDIHQEVLARLLPYLPPASGIFRPASSK